MDIRADVRRVAQPTETFSGGGPSEDVGWIKSFLFDDQIQCQVRYSHSSGQEDQGNQERKRKRSNHMGERL